MKIFYFFFSFRNLINLCALWEDAEEAEAKSNEAKLTKKKIEKNIEYIIKDIENKKSVFKILRYSMQKMDTATCTLKETKHNTWSCI